MKKLLKRTRDFSALFAGNDTVAIGAMRALDEAGLRIPDDVAVVGFDDVPLAAYINPPLTTLRTDPIAQGEGAVDLLMARISGEPYERIEESYATELVIRRSCGAQLAAQRQKTVSR